MIKKIAALSLILFLSFSGAAPAFDWSEKGGGKSGDKVLAGATLDVGKQGHSLGFVDADGDGIKDMIVGAPYAFTATNIGGVLLHKGLADDEFSSLPSMLLTGDNNFGSSFVNLGDLDEDGMDDFAIGAMHGDGPDVSLSGSVTVFKGGSPWNYGEGLGKIIAKLSGEWPLDKFGLFMTAGDLNGDGLKDLVVGAPFNTNDPSVYQGGAVYVFSGPDFINRITLYASAANKGLGWSAATGDINGDHVADLCLSASGKVLCYYSGRGFNPLIDEPDVTIKSGSAGFGKAMAVIGDLDGDGYGEIVIGAPNAAINEKRDTGSIFLIKGGTGTGIRIINADDATSPDRIARIDGEALFNRFGISITAVDDIDGDQMADFVVGASMADVGPFYLTGKIYLFKGMDISASTTLADATIFEGSAKDQGFGTALAAGENGRLLIGAPRTSADTGGVFLVDLTSAP